MAFKSTEEVFRYIESFTNLERSGSLFSARTYRLDRMRLLLESFDNPQLKYRTVHIAGTKGKGSTAALLAYSLQAAGLRTGLYTSPHVTGYLERMQVIGEEAEVSILLGLADRIRSCVDSLPEPLLLSAGPPSTFELLTLLAFCYFHDVGCRFVVVETGIGGRLDATNLVAPELCLITPIELEHTDVLGDTLEAVADEKAGIFKPGTPVFSSPQQPEVEAVLQEAAERKGCPILFLDRELQSFQARSSPAGTELRFRLRGQQEVRYNLELIGDFQGENAALVHLAARKLALSPEALRQGFSRARLPGRMEIVRKAPAVVLDGAHTPRSVQRVLETFNRLFGRKGVLLFAAAAGKKTAEMAALLAPAFRMIVVTTPGSFRESNAAEVHRQFQQTNPQAILVADTARALSEALSLAASRRPLLITGSFYLVGEVRRLLLGGGRPARAVAGKE